MSDFDLLGAEQDSVGFDYMKLAGGLVSGIAAGVSGDKKTGGTTDAAAAAEKQRMLDEKEKAQSSATMMKTILIVLGVLVGVGGLVAITRRPAVTP